MGETLVPGASVSTRRVEQPSHPVVLAGCIRFPNGDSQKLKVLEATTGHISQHMNFLAQQSPPPAPDQGGAPPPPDQTQSTTTELGISPMLAPENVAVEQAGSRMPALPKPPAPQAGPLSGWNNENAPGH